MKLTYEEMQDIYFMLEYYKKGTPICEYEFKKIDNLREKLFSMMVEKKRKEVKK